jgi:glycosyltransferase involved in cell wall biosynthesis
VPPVPDVVLPVLNEAENLPWILQRFPAGFRAVVVDNGSTDGSADVAKEHGAMVVREPKRGFGSACWTGLQACEDEIVCFMDADGSLDPLGLPMVAGLVAHGDADLALARRIPDRGAWHLHTRIANRVIAAQLGRRTGVRLHDLGPMRAVRREGLLDLGLADRRSGWPLEMVLRAEQQGWSIREVAVAYHRRRAGVSKETGTWRGTTRAVIDMSRVLRSL